MKKLKLLCLVFMFVSLSSCGDDKKEIQKVEYSVEAEAKNYVDAFGEVNVGRTKNIFIDFETSINKLYVMKNQKIKLNDILAEIDTNTYLGKISIKEDELMDLQKEKQHIIQLNGLATDSLEISKDKYNNLIQLLNLDLIILQDELSKKQKEYDDQLDPEVIKLQNELSSAEKLYDKILEESNSSEILYGSGVIAKQEYEDIKIKLNTQKKVVDNLKLSIDARFKITNDRIDEIKKSIDGKNKEIDAAKHSNDSTGVDLKIQEAAMNTIEDFKAQILNKEIAEMKKRLNKEYLDNTTIISAVKNGIVYEIYCEEGDIIGDNTKVFTIADLDTLYVTADITEDSIGSVKVGAYVEVIPTADKSKIYKGKVLRIASRAIIKDSDTIIPIDIELEHKDDFLKPGYTVDAKVYIDK